MQFQDYIRSMGKFPRGTTHEMLPGPFQRIISINPKFMVTSGKESLHHRSIFMVNQVRKTLTVLKVFPQGFPMSVRRSLVGEYLDINEHPIQGLHGSYVMVGKPRIHKLMGGAIQ